MKKLVNSITRFFNSNTVWMHLSVFLIFSFFWANSFSRNMSPVKIYLHPEKVLNSLTLFGTMVVLYSPYLIFTHFQKTIKDKIGPIFTRVVQIILYFSYTYLVIFTTLGEFLSIQLIDQFHIAIPFIFLSIDFLSEVDFKNTLKNNKLLSLFQSSDILFFLVCMVFINAVVASAIISESDGKFSSFFGGLTIGIQTTLFFSIIYAFYYLNTHYFLPRIFKEKGIVRYVFIFLLFAFVSTVILCFLIQNLEGLQTVRNYSQGKYWLDRNPPAYFYTIHLRSFISIFSLIIPFSFFSQWSSQNKKINTLAHQKQQAEVTQLKQNINPHFFFNTLNNLYALSLTQDRKTPEVIMQLSELMRYVIYEGPKERVNIGDEVKYLRDYIAIQKIRFSQNLDLKLHFTIEDDDFQIAPLLFIILIENAIKHGIEVSDEDAFLHITLEQNQDGIYFECKNSKEKELKLETTGVGLKNLIKRLDLIYPESYEYDRWSNKEEYCVTLKIWNH